MKSTQERLSEVYCVLKSDKEATAVFHVDCAYLMHYPETWGKGDKVMVTDGMLGVWYNSTRTEITVSQFIDLLKDSIVPWRLEEDGWEAHPFKVGDLHNHYTRPVPAQDYNFTVTFLFEKTSEHPYDYILPPNLQEVFICINKNSLPTCGSCGRVGIDTDYVTSFDGITTYTDLLTLIRLIG